MSVQAHLHVSPAGYDRRIRELIPLYDELLPEVVRALGFARRPLRRISELGVGTGALASRCLDAFPRARLRGIDADADMLAVAAARLGRRAARATLVAGDFVSTPLPPCDAIVASYALHHIRTPRRKQAFYRACRAALRPGGVLVIGDCCPASTPAGVARDLDVWFTHLARSAGSRAAARRIYESWASEDTYMPLADELRWLTRAGFEVDVPWRKSPFAVVVASVPARSRARQAARG
ncbi:MAG: class I SAM-dependent methyltransferase [Vicinamibacterales bacterium]